MNNSSNGISLKSNILNQYYLIEDGLEELIEEAEENSKEVKLSEYLVLKYIS